MSDRHRGRTGDSGQFPEQNPGLLDPAGGTPIENVNAVVLLTRTASSQRSRGCRRGAPLRARLSAVFLVLLIALPFTAPFSTCDLATLLAAPAPHAIEHSLGSTKVDSTSLGPVVTMEEEDHVCDLEAPLATTETVTVVAAVAGTILTDVVVRTSPLPLRL